jgi:hypothetical protein
VSEPKITTRAEARARGVKRYFLGRPCKQGHIAERYVACCHCVICTDEKFWRWYPENKARFIAGVKAWQKANPEKTLEYYHRQMPANRERAKKWYEKYRAIG